MGLFGFDILDIGAQDAITLDDVMDGLIPDGSDACCSTNSACNKNKSDDHGQR